MYGSDVHGYPGCGNLCGIGHFEEQEDGEKRWESGREEVVPVISGPRSASWWQVDPKRGLGDM